MNIRRSTLAAHALATGLLLAGAGCNIVPEPQADPTRYYILSASETNGTPQAKAPVVYLREVDLASYLRSRPLIVRRGENEIEFREFSRWGEPLELGIARVLREELVARGVASAVRVRQSTARTRLAASATSVATRQPRPSRAQSSSDRPSRTNSGGSSVMK